MAENGPFCEDDHLSPVPTGAFGLIKMDDLAFQNHPQLQICWVRHVRSEPFGQAATENYLVGRCRLFVFLLLFFSKYQQKHHHCEVTEDLYEIVESRKLDGNLFVIHQPISLADV